MTSYRRIPAATATLSDSTRAPAGWRSGGRLPRPATGLTPAPSLPDQRAAIGGRSAPGGQPVGASRPRSRPPRSGPLEPGPGHQLLGRCGHGGQPEAGAHAAADHLGVGQIGRAFERHHAGGARAPARCGAWCRRCPDPGLRRAPAVTSGQRGGCRPATSASARSRPRCPGDARCRPASSSSRSLTCFDPDSARRRALL